MRTAREEIFVHMANYPKAAREEFFGLPPKLFLELEPLYEFVCKLYSTGVPNRMSPEELTLSVKWVEFGVMKEHDPLTHRLVSRLYEEYKQERIKNANPQTQEDMERVLAEVSILKPPKDRPNKEILWQILEEETEGRLQGVKTGVPVLDDYTLGLKPGHLWIVGGFTNVGKSMFMNDIILETAKDNPTMLFSLEMPKRDILHRMLRECRYRTGEINGKDTGQAMDMVNDLQLEIVDNNPSLSSILAGLQVRADPPKIIWIDFIQNLFTQDRTEYERMTNVARELQAFAREKNICIVGLSQISNESANTGTKTAGFKGSGAIEAACDVGIVLSRNREETTDHVAFEVNLKKNRHGRTVAVDYQFDKDTGRISYRPVIPIITSR